MKEQLQKKITQFEDILLTRLQTNSGIDLNKPEQRDSREVLMMVDQMKVWLEDYNRLKSRWDSYDVVVTSFFIEETPKFELTYSELISKEILSQPFHKVNEIINNICWALAYEKIKQKLIGRLIGVTSNS